MLVGNQAAEEAETAAALIGTVAIVLEDLRPAFPPRLEAEEARLSRLLIAQEVVEGLRGKLRRLVERGRLAQDEPGLFALTEQVHRQIAQ